MFPDKLYLLVFVKLTVVIVLKYIKFFDKNVYVTKLSNVRHLSLQPENLCRLDFLLSMLYFVYSHKALFCVFSNMFISAVITGSSVISYLCSKKPTIDSLRVCVKCLKLIHTHCTIYSFVVYTYRYHCPQDIKIY